MLPTISTIFSKNVINLIQANRDQDKIGLYENYNRLKPIYDKSYNKNTTQSNYENCIKTVKGVDGILNINRTVRRNH